MQTRSDASPGSKSLHSFGQKAIVLAALGAAAAATTGLIAGEEVNAEGDARDMLMTHHNLNFVATIVAACMRCGAPDGKSRAHSTLVWALRGLVSSPTRPISAASSCTSPASVCSPRTVFTGPTHLHWGRVKQASSPRRRERTSCTACSTWPRS